MLGRKLQQKLLQFAPLPHQAPHTTGITGATQAVAFQLPDLVYVLDAAAYTGLYTLF